MNEPGTGIRLIPPFVFFAGFIVAGAIQWLWPLHLGLPAALRWIAGGVLIVAPLIFAQSLFARFRAAGNTFDTRKVPQALVTGGAYRFSRNPGHLAVVVIGIGIAVLLDNPWVLLGDAAAALIVQQQVIVKEEALLESLFGEEYRQYKARVRRWL